MVLSKEEWERQATPTKPDVLALHVLGDALPVTWMRMSPYQLMNGAAVMAMRYDRKRQAEALRDRVLHTVPAPEEVRLRASLPPELREAYDFLAGRFEATLFEIADQVEQGTMGMLR